MPKTLTLPEKVVEYINVSSIALEKAAADQSAKEAQTAKIAALIPKVVNALVDGERITEDQRQKAAQVLRDPVQVLELLTKVAVHRNADEQTLGKGVDAQTKQANASGNGSYDSTQDPRVGMRTTMEKKSDNAFKRGLGIS